MSDLHSSASSTCEDDQQTFITLGISLRTLAESELGETKIADSFFDVIHDIGSVFKHINTMPSYFYENKDDLGRFTAILEKIIDHHILHGDFDSASEDSLVGSSPENI
jgi:hypothetical protein